MKPLTSDLEEIKRAVALFLVPGGVIELRAPKTSREGVISGYFSDPLKLAQAARAIDSRASGIYVTLNPVNPTLLARADNRVKPRSIALTADSDVVRRRWLLLDFDPVRPAGISSTAEEHDLALDGARRAASLLTSAGWPLPVVADSGNGGHLLYRVDLPNDAPAAELVRAALAAAAQRWNVPQRLDVDRGVFNASRISKIYGSIARKGDPTEDRPHRLSRILSLPDLLNTVPTELLQSLAAEFKPETAARRTARARSVVAPPVRSDFDLERFIIDKGIAINRGPDVHQGSERWVLEHCPFNPAHAAPDAAIFRVVSSGRLGFKCLHNSCVDKDWEAFREFYEPGVGRKQSTGFQPFAPIPGESDSRETAKVAAEENRSSLTSAASAAKPDDWRKRLLRSPRGEVLPLLANAVTALSSAEEWQRLLCFNEFAVHVQTTRQTVWGKKTGERWSDNDDRQAALWLQHAGIYVNTHLAGEAIQTVALMRRIHPLRDYLLGLEWDGRPRLNRWARTYLGATKEIEDIFARKWAISAVARGLQPGAKADCALVLESPQGAGKSTAARKLAGDCNFTDQISDLGSKDAVMQINGIWICELSELDALSRIENSRIKAFMSATSDRIRLPYGKNVIDWPRSSVFIGTVNHDAYLTDSSGARRWWPVRCGRIDVQAIARDRDMLWAEAVDQFNHGATWWLEDENSIQQAVTEQSDRYQGGQWDSGIAEWLENPIERLDAQGHPSASFNSTAEFVSVADILSHCIGKHKSQWTRSDEMSVSASLKSLGWERFRRRDGDRNIWLYRRKR